VRVRAARHEQLVRDDVVPGVRGQQDAERQAVERGVDAVRRLGAVERLQRRGVALALGQAARDRGDLGLDGALAAPDPVGGDAVEGAGVHRRPRDQRDARRPGVGQVVEDRPRARDVVVVHPRVLVVR
jgi:hypothetical protein